MKVTPGSVIRRALESRRVRGFTMVEMLVALVVLAVGMLGVAGLFVISLRSGGTAISRMQAVNLASDMADRIRSNRRGRDVFTRAGADRGCAGAAAVNCSVEQMAETDLFLWRQQIAAAFPGNRGEGIVEYLEPASATDPAVYTVIVRWREQGRAANELESVQSVTTRIETLLN
jgi:type IV pilus assembly protein PilV